MKWTRRFPNSLNNFDLMLTDPGELDSVRMNALLDRILAETRRGLSLGSRASTEFRRFFAQPDTFLKSEAMVLLSNWFMTNSGDRHSTVASCCEDLWDALFPCRPANRLSSPQPGRNHAMIPAEFQNFWRRLSEAQGERVPETEEASGILQIGESPGNDRGGEGGESSAHLLRARFDKGGLHCEVEGPPAAVADFLKRVSRWEAEQY